jgi:hypothetical protein
MTEERLLRRLRAANPMVHVSEPAGAQDLFAEIVAAPGDARLGAGRSRGPWWRQIVGPRRLALVAAVFLLVAAGGTAGVIGIGAFAHDPPRALFVADPQGRGPGPGSGLWRQRVIPSTVHRAVTLPVSGFGPVQLWVADSRQHGICTALRLPDASWSGLGGSPLDGGGTVPGCRPTRVQINGASPVYVIDGFDYVEAIVRRGGTQWRIEYGQVARSGRDGAGDAGGRPVAVRDVMSGRSVPVARGGWFAIAFRIRDPNALPGFRLEALDARGQVVAREPAG